MGKSTAFKDTFSFEERCQESQDIIARYPDRLPVVVERYTKTDLPEMEKKKYLVPRDMLVAGFICLKERLCSYSCRTRYLKHLA
ncbi:hypothetical protein L1987_13010 [Smallanthus sonchifolius]|uniref:Uncharacterized protein n=1 Tax=Smallanthus sonchifolius TaxID=185202 RepID=A0ACB9JI16_9ASTR|nr:hypothetical protein L1987_13010 [Smallanthus sonchifolius]